MGSVVLLSGGLDSAAAAVYARRFLPLPTVALWVAYGSMHEITEYASAQSVAGILGIELQTAYIRFPGKVDSPLLRDAELANERIASGSLCIVPMRNTLLLALAASLAYSLSAEYVVYGAHTADELGYPDCRREFAGVMEQTIQKSLDRDIRVVAPLLYPENTIGVLAEHGLDTSVAVKLLKRTDVPADVRGKTFSFLLLDLLGYPELIELTHSCYAGISGGCGQCATCRLREAAAELYRSLQG